MHYKNNDKNYHNMENAQKNNEIGFREWYNSLDTQKKREFREQLLQASGMQFPTFYSKLQRNCSFNPLEQKAIQEIVGNDFKIIFP